MHSLYLHTAFLGLSPGPFEILILLAAVLMLFGAKRVPEFARSLGKVMEELRRASQDFKHQLMEVEEEIRSDTEEFIREPPEFVVNRIEEEDGDIEVEADTPETEPPAAEDAVAPNPDNPESKA